MRPSNGTEIEATGSVHLSLQGKGRVGKSLVASILAQYLNGRARAIRCIDSDPVNKTFSQYKSLRCESLPLLREGGVDQRAFDGLMEDLLTNDGIFVVDNGVIIERGTHDSLIAQGGLYSHIYREQMQDQERVRAESDASQ